MTLLLLVTTEAAANQPHGSQKPGFRPLTNTKSLEHQSKPGRLARFPNRPVHEVLR